MAEDREITPEKQLLKLIEESKRGQGPSGTAGPAARLRRGAGFLSPRALLGAVLGRLSFFRRSANKRIGTSRRSFNLSAANRLLTAAVVALSMYVVTETIASAVALSRPPRLGAAREPSAAAAGPAASPLRESDFYLQKVLSRDIFREAGRPKEAVREEEPAPAEMSEAIKSLSLVGISWSANPDVIIEDKAQQKTYFVKRGQLVGDGVKVEAVFKDRVVLSHEGQEYELR